MAKPVPKWKESMKTIKKVAILVVALVALLAIPALASATGPHQANHNNHGKVCKKGFHRNGKKCVKTHTVIKPVPGPQGQTGAAGPTGPTGPEGPQGESAPVSPFTYDNIEPASFIDNPVSLGYAATGTTEFGSQIVNTEEVSNAEVEVLLSSWTCEEGEWNNDCVTNDPAATFPAELTLNVYSVTYENKVGSLLSETTETFNVPYRPTSDCLTDTTKFVGIDGKCNHGLPVPVNFVTGDNLPRKVIVTVSFTPSGPTDSLNVGVEGPASVGQNPLESREGVYWNSLWFGTQTGLLRLEEFTGEWQPGESQLAAIIQNG
jgi:hypothetical protein